MRAIRYGESWEHFEITATSRNPLCVQLDMEQYQLRNFYPSSMSQSAMRAIRYGVRRYRFRRKKAASQSAMRAIRYGVTFSGGSQSDGNKVAIRYACN